MAFRPDRVDRLLDCWSKVRGDLDISPLAVWGRVTIINELFHAAIGQVLRRHDVTFNEFQVLAALSLSNGPDETSPNQIARQNLLTSGGMTNLLNKMERAGLIRRQAPEPHRRGVVVGLTALGERKLFDSMTEENAREHDLLAALTETEAMLLATLLRKLLLSLQPGPERPEPRTSGG